MRPIKKLAAVLLTCAVVACGAFMPSVASLLQDHWLHAQAGTRNMDMLNSLDLSDPSAMDAFWMYSNATSSIPMRQGKNMSSQDALSKAHDVYELLRQSGIIHDIGPSEQSSSAYPELMIADIGEVRTALIWRCSWWNEYGYGSSMALDDVTGKMLSLQLSLPPSDDAAEDPQRIAERWLEFCRSYYGEPDIGMARSDISENAWTMSFPVSNGDLQYTQDVYLFISHDVISFH